MIDNDESHNFISEKIVKQLELEVLEKFGVRLETVPALCLGGCAGI